MSHDDSSMRGFTPRYEYALEALRKIRRDRLPEYDLEDTVRFCSLRLCEVGIIKSRPQKIIAENTAGLWTRSSVS